MKELQCFGHAKINLGLDVVRKREDGYHEVRMVMQTLDLCDRIDLKKEETAGIRLSILGRDDLAADANNLAYKAARSLFDEAIKDGRLRAEACGVSILLEKKIPMAAGLAGGSADAAAVLRGINELFALGYSMEELQKIGVRIGADVPYCVMEGTALAEGIGEVLTKLPNCPKMYCLLAKPPIDVPTKFVYGNLRANELTSHPDIDGMVTAIATEDVDGIVSRMGNVLETVTIPAHPVIQEIKDLMLQHHASNAMMSGSGPTVFGIFASEEEMMLAKKAIWATGIAPELYGCQLFSKENMYG